jgi:hypothetical protein
MSDYKSAATEIENSIDDSSAAEQEIIKKTPPPTTNQAGTTPQAAKKAGSLAKELPHVMFGAFGGPQHGTSFANISQPHHLAHSLGIAHGLCNHLGQVNKVGQTLLNDMHDKGLLKKSHYMQTPTHCVVMVKGVEALLNHHGIDPVNGGMTAHAVASDIAGQALGTEDMPEGVDWYDVAKQIAMKDTVPEIPQTLIQDTADKLEISPDPEMIGNPHEAHLASLNSEARRLNAAYESGDIVAIATHEMNLHNAVDDMVDSGGLENEISDTVTGAISEKYHGKLAKGMVEIGLGHTSIMGGNIAASLPADKISSHPDLTEAAKKWAGSKDADSAASEVDMDMLTTEVNNAKEAGVDVSEIHNHIGDIAGHQNAAIYYNSFPEGENPLDSSSQSDSDFNLGPSDTYKNGMKEQVAKAAQEYANVIATAPTDAC